MKVTSNRNKHKETTGVCRQWQKLVNCLTCLWLELFCYFSATDDISSSLLKQVQKILLEMSSVAENNRIIPAIDKLDNQLVSVTDDKPL